MYKEQLSYIGQRIVNAAGIDEEVSAVKLLSDFLRAFPARTDETLQAQYDSDTHVQGGIAIQPSAAADCVEEYIRTARFIKGTYLAINTLKLRFPGEKIHALYAGCGPYATILVAILPLFNEHEIDVVLLDIHDYSTTSAKALFTLSGIGGYIRDTITTNAVTYAYPDEVPLHLVISETMFLGLTREPQVAITANLAPRLTKNGILIPEEISIDVVYTMHAYEPFIDPLTQVRAAVPSPSWEEKRVVHDTVFTVSLDHNFNDLHSRSAPFESTWYPKPEQPDQNPDIDLFTRIRVFDTIELGLAESTISNPYCVSSFGVFGNNNQFRLLYHFNDVPYWSYELRE